jgi:hypothetical protein
MFQPNDLSGIVKGNRYKVSQGVREMNTRASDSNRAAPWHGNRPGQLNSNAAQLALLEAQGWVSADDYEESYDYAD